MYSSDKKRQRMERILEANQLLLRMDSKNFQGVVELSFKRDEGLLTYVIKEHGTFNKKPREVNNP